MYMSLNWLFFWVFPGSPAESAEIFPTEAQNQQS